MSIWEALILGIIQGLTEFLPVSSSGHLELAKEIFGGDRLPEESLFFTLLLHFATALSTIVVFRKDIASLFRGSLRNGLNESNKYILYIVISMIPAAAVGLFFEDEIVSLFGGRIALVGAMLLVTAAFLLIADFSKDRKLPIGPWKALIVGVLQAIALMPGISRSGATISAGISVGLSREEAARFSFLMVIPLILGKMILDIGDIERMSIGDQGINYLVGFLAAFFSGMLACKWMIALVKRSKLWVFAIYCVIVGCIALFVS